MTRTAVAPSDAACVVRAAVPTENSMTSTRSETKLHFRTRNARCIIVLLLRKGFLLLETSVVSAKTLKNPLDPEGREGDHACKAQGKDQKELRVAQDALQEPQPLVRGRTRGEQ